MKIAIFTNTYWPSRNGVAIAIKLLRECLIALGHTVLVFAPAYPGEEYEDPDGVFRFPAIGYGDYPLAKLIFVRSWVKQILIEHKIELIYLPHPWWVSSLGLSLAKELNLTAVAVIHTQYDKMVGVIPLIGALAKRVPVISRLVGKILWWKVRRFCNAVDLVTTPGVGMQKHLMQLGVKTPVWVTPNPTDLDGFGNADGSQIRAGLNIPANAPVIGYVSRLVREKDPDQNLAAFELVRKQVPEAHLLVVGDGPMRAQLERQAKAIGNVHFIGAVNHDQVAKYLSILKLFISASKFEVQPLTYIEALAAGLAIVAYRWQGNEVVKDGDNGYLVSVDQGVGGLADKVVHLLRHSDVMSAMSKRAAESIQQFEKMTAARRTLQAMEEGLKHHNSPGAA